MDSLPFRGPCFPTSGSVWAAEGLRVPSLETRKSGRDGHHTTNPAAFV